MFECFCNLVRRNGMPYDRLAILSFDVAEANVVTTQGYDKLVPETVPSVDAESGILRFRGEDDTDVTVVIHDERDRVVAFELLQHLCRRVEW